MSLSVNSVGFMMKSACFFYKNLISRNILLLGGGRGPCSVAQVLQMTIKTNQASMILTLAQMDKFLLDLKKHVDTNLNLLRQYRNRGLCPNEPNPSHQVLLDHRGKSRQLTSAHCWRQRCSLVRERRVSGWRDWTRLCTQLGERQQRTCCNAHPSKPHYPHHSGLF